MDRPNKMIGRKCARCGWEYDPEKDKGKSPRRVYEFSVNDGEKIYRGCSFCINKVANIPAQYKETRQKYFETMRVKEEEN